MKWCHRLFQTLLLVVFVVLTSLAQPGGVGGSRLWLKANAGTTLSPSTEVQQWNDQSGNGFNATQATVVNRPLQISNRLNFNPSIQFTQANSQRLLITNGIMGAATRNNFNVFIVSRAASVSAGSIFYEDQASGGRINTHIPWSDGILYWDAGSAVSPTRLSTAWTGATGQSYLWTLMSSNTGTTPSGQKQDIYKNGLLLASDNDMAAFQGSNSTMTIGSLNAGNYFDGEISEIIMYTANLTSPQMQRINSYLALKYGLTMDQTTATNYLASNSTVIWDATAQAAYKFDIAGIGRDATSVLDQPKSTSSNTPSDLITIANSSISAPVSLADLQFLTWGNNGIVAAADPNAAAFNHNGPVTNIKASLRRIWSSKLTGAPGGNAIIEFNMNLVSGPTGYGTNANAALVLLIDDDAVFNNGSAGEATISPTGGFSASGGVVDFSVPYTNLTGQKFFTLASTNNTTCPLSVPLPGAALATLKLWLKADAGVTGNPVSSWLDKSGYGFDAAQTTVGARPTPLANRVNFNPSIQFNGSTHELKITGGIMGSAVYNDINVCAVTRTNTIAASSIFFETQAGGNRINAHVPWSDGFLFWDAGAVSASQRLSVGWGGVVNKYYLWDLTASTTATPSGLKQDIYRDGAIISNDNTMSSFTGGNQDMYIGSMGGFNLFNGEIAELLIYTSALTAPQLQNINSHLAVKYGITLNQSTPTDYTASNWNGTTGTKIWDATAAGAYKNDIAAIARDDNSALNQKQSGSSNSGNVLFIANTAFATDNPTNANTLSADKSFLSWAHNGGVLAASGVGDFTGPTIKGRLARVWKAQETGTVGNVTIRFDLSTVPGVGGVAGANDLNNTRLMVDADGVFAAGATLIAPSSVNNGTQVVEFITDFAAGTGFYFTVGTTNTTTTPLPVQLVSFSAKASDEQVDLSWVTESELNNDYFVVESSQDGESWNKILQVPGQGTITRRSEYTAVDAQPFQGTSYYRLRQVDFGGEAHLSKIVAVKFDGIATGLKMYPNPAAGEVNFELSGKYRATGIRISNLSGAELFKTALSDGDAQKQKFTVDLSGYQAGLYIVTLYAADALHHVKLVIK